MGYLCLDSVISELSRFYAVSTHFLASGDKITTPTSSLSAPETGLAHGHLSMIGPPLC